jgi:hypothetical protein
MTEVVKGDIGSDDLLIIAAKQAGK